MSVHMYKCTHVQMYNVNLPPDANIPPPVSATSASCAFKKKITILLNKYKYKSAEIQSKKVVLWKISVTFPINIGGRRRTRRKSLFISGFTMSTLCSRCNKNYIIVWQCPCQLSSIFFTEFSLFSQYPLDRYWIISDIQGTRSGSKRVQRILWSQPEIFQSSSLPAL